MKAGRKLVTGLLVMAVILGLPQIVMAHSGEQEVAAVEVNNAEDISVCIFIEENWVSFEVPSEQFECSDVNVFEWLPMTAREQILIELAQIENNDAFAVFWQFFEHPEPQAITAKKKYFFYSGGAEQWRGLVSQHFLPSDVDRALLVIDCETKQTGDPNIVNPTSGASGLFQHIPLYWLERSALAGWAGADIFSPEPNIAVAAYLVYQDSKSWGHWPNCGKL